MSPPYAAEFAVTALGGQFPLTFFLGLPRRIAGLRPGRKQPKVESGAIATGDLSRGAFVRCGGSRRLKRHGKSRLANTFHSCHRYFRQREPALGFAAGGKIPWTS